MGQAATRPGCTINYTVDPGNVILDLVYYVGLEAGACLRLAGQTRDDFEYGNRKSGRRFCQTHVSRSPKVLKVVSKRTLAVPWPGLPQRQSYPGASTSANLEHPPALTHLSSTPPGPFEDISNLTQQMAQVLVARYAARGLAAMLAMRSTSD